MNRKEINKKEDQEKAVILDIDYEKLAQAFIQVQKKTEREKSTNTTIRTRLLRFLNGCIYLIFSFGCFYKIYHVWFINTGNESTSIENKIIITVVLAILGILMFLSQQESLGESNRETSEFFNINLSLIAVVIALIAYYQSKVN